MKRSIGLAVVLISIIVLIIAFAYMKIDRQDYEATFGDEINFEVVASNLKIPWEIAFLSDGELIATERPGSLIRINNGKRIEVEGVKHRGEGGLLGMALHPEFKKNNLIYLYFTSEANGKIENRVERYFFDLENNLLREKRVIMEDIPGAVYHDGGRILFGPDGLLYITTGDAGNEDNAQNVNSLAGKILRVDEEGGIPKDNPFNNEIYSYGHRNSQGLAWDDEGRLWATEHGRSGIQSGLDELNLIEKGQNYGWPVIQGDSEKEGMNSPIIHSGSDTWAPAGAVYSNGRIFFTGLRGEALYEYEIEGNKLKTHFSGKFGRLRAIALYGDHIYFSTSNGDGRGTLMDGDDKIIKVKVEDLINDLA
ncbi:MAG: PQQ-dependent sugar dehydrogenase [Nanoarchaeota archaeon]|nr:PQQ-dependent sugar dehydrogenase [Nanoarchaeota archaeon]